MAEGGQSSLDEEESDEEIRSLVFLACTGEITLEQLKKSGDAKLRGKEYQKGFAIYSIALNCPIIGSTDVTIIAEQLYRKRAECLFKMGKYFEAIKDCEQAIEIADETNSSSLLSKSLFIKTTAIQNLGDYVNALPFAVWCKHLRPECEKIKATLCTIKDKLSEMFQDDFIVHTVLVTMLTFSNEMEMSRQNPEVAVECYSETLEILYFKFLPEVLLGRARCLLKLGRHTDAKNDCARVLWFESNNEKALQMMKQITENMKKTKEEETAKEKPEPQEEFRKEKKSDSQTDSIWSRSVQPFRLSRDDQTSLNILLDNACLKGQYSHREENAASAKVEGFQKQAELEQQQVEDEESAKAEKKRMKNKQKRMRKKERKKEQQKKHTGLDQQTISKTSTEADKNESDGVDSVTEEPIATRVDSVTKESAVSIMDSVTEEPSVIEEPAVSIPCSVNKKMGGSLKTLSSTFRNSVLCEDPFAKDFIPVQNSRRPRKQAAMAQDRHVHCRVQEPFSSPIEGKKQEEDVTSQGNTVPQIQQIYPSGALEIQESTNQRKREVPGHSSFDLEEFPPLDGSNLMSAHDPIKAPNASIKLPPPATMLNLKSDEKPEMHLSPEKRSSASLHALSSSSTTASHTTGLEKDKSRQPFLPVNLSQRSQSDSQSHEMSSPTRIPQGVEVVCDHFLQDNRTKPSSIHFKTKTCKECKDTGPLRFAVWNATDCCWQLMRPYPALKVPLRATLSVCKHFATLRPCPKDPCTFPHGAEESAIWEIEREGALPTPQEVLALAAAKDPATAVNTNLPPTKESSSSPVLSSAWEFPTKDNDALQTTDSNQPPKACFAMSSLEEFPRLGTALSKGSSDDATRNMSSSVCPKGSDSSKTTMVASNMAALQWAQASNFNNAPFPPRCSSQPKMSQLKPTTPEFIPAKETYANSLMKDSTLSSTERFTTDNVNSANSSAGGTKPLTHVVDISTTDSKSVPSSDMANVEINQKMSSNKFTKIPDGVFVVCDDFLQKNLRIPRSILNKSKACKGCENRSKLKYAFWNNNNRQWQIIRQYPEKVPSHVAFSVCRQYAINTPCLRIPCSFAHGQEELDMWTLEREGVLPTPRETLTGLPEKTDERSIHMQPQLKYRPSPPGVKGGAFKLCRSCYTHERCRFGRGCLYAHSNGELMEWQHEYLRKGREKLQKELQDNDEVLSMEMTTNILKGPEEDVVESLPGVDVSCNPPELSVKLLENNGKATCQWVCNLTFKTSVVGYLRHVLLLYRYHNCYQLSEIRVGCYQDYRGCESYNVCYSAKLKEFWYKAPDVNNFSGRAKVSLTVSFESSLYGSFDQCIVFDFGRKPYLVRRLNVDVQSGSLPQTSIFLQHATATAVWDERSMDVVRFVHKTGEALQGEHLSRIYSLQKQENITAEELRSDNYKTVMHQLLFVEEGFMKRELSSYTLGRTQLHAQWSVFDDMSGMKFAVDNELFGVLYLQEEDALRPDDAAGRLLYRNVSSVWLQLADSVSNKVYEAPVEKVESECVVLRLSSKTVSDLLLYDTCDVSVNAQFQLNRWPLCEMHAAIDRITTAQLRLIFPEPRVPVVRSEVTIRWRWLLDKRLNDNQKEVIKQIASPEYNSPPLVVFGPFGTGKTFTLNQAVRLLVQLDKSHRILLCTHSNRAADIHVELLHKYLTEQNGSPAARPLRIYQPMRRLETTSEIARNYCLTKGDMFVLPSRDDLVEHRVVVTTLSTSQVLLDLQVLHGFFTHILIDEAAQALEPEALTPLIYAGPNTKVVFTGDHMQMSPEVYSPEARRLGLQKSLAERLFDIYDKHEAQEVREYYVLFLTENYRCHPDILKFPSDNFYGEKLLARGGTSQLAHPKYGPLLFFSARGKEYKEHDNSYVNLSEVYEVVKRVKEVADNWPTQTWGPTKLSDIAVLSAYRYQVQTIRNSLRKEADLKDVKVDTIHNVQGEEFRALFISTVRTFHTCKPQQEDVRAGGSDRPLYWEFLSDPKLLNTAVTRARCLVAVVGDPVSLCTVGECRSIWRDYIKRCNEKGGLYGVTMEELDKEINAAIAGIELNPKAEPFVPKALSVPEKSINTEVGETRKVHDSKEIAEETQKDKNDGKDGKEKGQEISDKSDAKLDEDSLNVNDQCHSGKFINTSPDINQETNKVDGVDEKDDEERIVEPGDFQDDLLDDETVSPRDLDEIILAFVKKCEETLQSDAARLSMFQDSEFPPLEATGSKAIRPQTDANRHRFSVGGREELKEFFPEIHVINGRVEVHLTNLGFYSSPSERAQRIIASTKQQEFLDPSVLRQLLSDEPDKYKVCNLRLNPEKSQVGYAEIEDTETPDIEIKGRVRQAFDRDKVVLELIEKRTRSNADSGEFRFQGKVVGVLEHSISPHERQFVCTTDYRNPALMLPINKSAPKLVNLSDKSCKDIPIYRKDQNNRAIQVKMIEREKVLSGKYLFVVKYLQWKREFCYPLGIIVRMLPRGEDFKSSLEIAYAERGIRRVFKDDAMKYVKEKFPPQWLIPENEYATRTRIEKAFTIDPPTSLDLDDALTIESISLATFRVGIHIADVSFFVTPDSPLDNEAFLRGTSYYPGEGQKNLPMLPNELSEGHCSLLPDKDRLAVSVFITLDKDGNVTDEPKIQRTIVRSCCRLSYAEAQMIIDKREIGSKQVAKEIVDSVRQLNGVAQMRRCHRLGDESFDHWQNEESGEYFEAHELVEEMMILANEEVAKLLSRKCPELALLRVQLPPKDLRLADWVEKHGRYLRLSLQFSGIFRNSTKDEVSSLALLHSEKTMFKIQRWVWDGIRQAAESNDLPTLRHLICNERNHPQIAAAQSQFRRIQSQSRYVCEGDHPSANIHHYSLGIRSYTHFTSPIRRYIDISVHRLLLGLESPGCHKDNISKDDMAKVCRRSTFLIDNARKFGKDCKRIRLATTLQQQCHVTRVFIESIEKQSISLYICNPEDDHLAGKQKRMFISDMNPVALTEEEIGTDGEKCLVLTWKIRRYIAPDGSRNVKEESNAALSGHTGVNEIVEIPSDMWIQVLDTVRANDTGKLPSIIKQMETRLSIMSPSSTEMKRTQHKLPAHTRGEHYKHPHYGEKTPPSSNEAVFHFYEMKLALRKYNFLSVQLCPHMTRGILQPDIQMVNLNPYLNICIEHRKYPRESFAHTARHQASREQYETIDEYINAWKPVLAMEAATEAVKENDGFVIEHLSVEWEKEDESLTGFFTLTLVYCKNRQVEFYPGDLVCVRVPFPPKECSSFEKQGQRQSCSSYSHQGSFWVSHCIIDEVIEVKKEKVEVTMKHHQAASNIPAEITHGGSHRCTLELIHRTLPQRRMYAALCVNLRHSSELVHAICKGEEPKRETFGSLPPDLSLEQHGFKRLNHYQEAAVKEALSNPFSLIQGPPGTGKTVTGVHIANWFAQRNQRLTYKVLEKGKRKKEDETAYRAPPQLIYCGPSNKAVDVVTEYLMKIPSLKILRVYSDQIEQKEFPIPNKLKPARITRSEDELKMSSEKIRSVSLHHLIRSDVCPCAEELRTFEEGFAENKARGEPISEDDVAKYCKLIGHAERWALEESGVQIILCTCATAGSPRIANSCDNIQQCIVDECGMCLEPESLVPITSSGARQVVLIGDHKQLQPVIQDQVAKALGLSVSMFERHSKRARMLQLQYRMHKGICEFPSKEFYDDKLQTAEVVNSRPPSPVSFWPAQVRRRRDLPIVFCHVEGQEESSVITTSESNQESKRNMKEVRKVVQVAKYLVNRDSVRKSDVVILSPYREQRSKISELLRGAYDDIHVTTITKSQGSEWDYVIMSLVRSLKKEEIDPEPSLSWLGEHLGFLRDEHQMNVGLTRARRGLCIIGNKNLLGMDEMWSKLIEHYENNHCLVDESWPWT